MVIMEAEHGSGMVVISDQVCSGLSGEQPDVAENYGVFFNSFQG